MLNQELVFAIFLEQRRKSLQLTHKQLAQMLGYKNTNKGIRRIIAIEAGQMDNTLVPKIMKVLDVSEVERRKCLLGEQLFKKQELKKLPTFEPKLIWRAMACIYIPQILPKYLTSKASMIVYSKDFARTRNAHCRLELDYDYRYYISKIGEISKPDRRLNYKIASRTIIGEL